MPIKVAGREKGKGIPFDALRLLRASFRLHKPVRFANRLASLRMTQLWALLFSLALFGTRVGATTYYVSSSTGNDGNSGTSASTPWQTIGHVNGQTFSPGDSILFKRGDVWNESLTPPSSGTSGNPITFDAYGTGAAPNLTGYYAVPAAAWVLVTGNAWKAPVPATYSTINFCLFGSIWGQKVAAATSNLTAQWDFYLANGFVYVYSVGNPATFYNEAIVPMALSNVPVINVNGKSWLTFQHFLVNWFDQYGVYVQGTSDHLVFANMEADSMIPQGTQPLGFYVNESTPGPGDIKLYNDEAHLNYDAFRFDGSATAISMVNDKAYGSRDGALVDNTGAVTYSHCHFYASSLAVAGSTDVEWTSGSGPTAGAGNIAADTPPAVQAWQRYPAEVTLTVDDAGMTPGADSYYASQVLPVADAAGVPVGAAITVGYSSVITPIISEIQGWINAGRDVTSHSVSHTYYPNTDALDIQYTGSGTAATLSIGSKTLTITVAGASDGVSYNLAQGQEQGTILGLQQALAATGKFTTSYLTPCQGPYGTGCSAYTAVALLAQDLADVSGQDVKSAVYHLQLDTTRLTTDEITLSRQWMSSNLTGLPATPVYVYPGGYETTAMQGIAEGVPYSGARGALKEDLGVKDTYASGFNVQNVTSFGVNPSWMGLAPAALNQKIQALVWKEKVWGVPWGIFWHMDELTNTDPVGGTEITNLIQDLKASGATIQTNTSLVNWLLGGTQQTGTDGTFYYKSPAASIFSANGGLDFRPTAASPVVDAGQNLGSAYSLDINGVNQNSYGSGWEIGAHAFIAYSTYGAGGPTSESFKIGDGVVVADDSAYCPADEAAAYPGGATTDGPAGLPQTCVNTAIATWAQPATVKWTCPAGQLIPTDSPDGRGGQACDYATVAAMLAATPGNGCGVWYKIKSTSGISLASEPAGTQNIYAENNLTIPAGVACSKTAPVWITSDQYSNLAATGLGEGQRATMAWVGVPSGTTTLYPPYANPNATGYYFPEIRNGGVNVPTLSADATTSHLRIMGIEFTSAAGVAIDNKLIVLPAGSDHIILDRVLVHCGDSKTLTHGNSAFSSCSDGVSFSGTYEALINSTDADIYCGTGNGYGQCPEGHGIGWGTTLTATNEGPYKVVNNFISAGGEGILTGGGATQLTPVDAEIRRNSFYKPLYWDDYACYLNSPLGTAGSLPSWCVDPYGNPVHTWSKFEISSITCSGGLITATSTLPPIYIPSIAGTSKVSFINVADTNFDQNSLTVATSAVSAGVLTLTASTSGTCDASSSGGEMSFGGIEVKNHLEFKNQNRALIEGNTFTNEWWGDSDQFGEAIHLNDIGNAGDTVPGGVAVENVTIRYNLVQHANKGIIFGSEINGLVGTGALGPFSVHDNIFDDINGSRWAVTGDGRISIFTAWGSLPYGQQSLTITGAAGSLSCAGGVVTARAYYSLNSPPMIAGQPINVAGAGVSGYNGGPFTLASVSNNVGGAGYPTSTLTWPVASCPGSASSGGTIKGAGPGGSPYGIAVVHNTAILNLPASAGSNRMTTADVADNSNVTPLTGTASVDATGLILTYVSGSNFATGCATYGNGGWVGAPFIINGVGAYPVASSPCPTSTTLTLTTAATAVAGTTISFNAPCVSGCTTNLANPWSGISFLANVSAGGLNPTGYITGGGSTGAANGYFVSSSCGSGAGGITNVCWCVSDNVWPSQQQAHVPVTTPYPSANPAGNTCANAAGGNNHDSPDHTLATVGFANYNGGNGGGNYALCTGAGIDAYGPDSQCTAASAVWNSGTSSWGTFDGLAPGANVAKVNAYTSGPPPALPPLGGVAVAQMPLTGSQSSLYSTLMSNVLPSSDVEAAAPLVNWNAIESNTTPGSYSWTAVDSQLLSLTATGKRLRLIVALASESGSSQTAGGGNNATPAYVFGSAWATTVGAANPQDMSVCANYEGDTGSPYGHSGFTTGGIWNSSNATYGSDLSGLPVSYELPFKTAAKKFVTQLTQHFSNSCSQFSSDCSNGARLAPLIDYVRVGFSEGGEDSPLCNSFWPLPPGYTTFQGVYLDGSNSGGQTGYVDEMTGALASDYASYQPRWVFIFDTHDLTGFAHTYADHEALAAARAGFGFGTNGFQTSDLTNCPGAQCTSDWYSNFAAYPQVPHYLQTLQSSCPDNSCSTGNLVTLLTFAEQNGVDALELYPCDLLLADAPSAYPGTGAQACSPTFSTSYSPSYATAVTLANTPP